MFHSEGRTRRSPSLHEASIQVNLAGICGTDLAIWSGGYAVPLPLVLGHEWVGRVVDVGNHQAEQAVNLIGKRVTGEINNTCISRGIKPPCEACLRLLPSHCLNRTVTGIICHDGAFQEEMMVLWRNLYLIPDEMSDEEAILIEPLAAAVQTFELTPLKPDDFVVILGAGRLGMLTALVAKARGARVLTTTRNKVRAERLRKLGLRTFLMGKERRISPKNPLAPAATPLLEVVMNQTAGLGADLVVESTGDPDGLGLALDIVRPRGAIAMKSTPGLNSADFELTRCVVNEITLQGSRCGSFDKAIVFQLKHRLPLRQLVNKTFPLAQIEEAFDHAVSHPGKVAIQMDQSQ